MKHSPATIVLLMGLHLTFADKRLYYDKATAQFSNDLASCPTTCSIDEVNVTVLPSGAFLAFSKSEVDPIYELNLNEMDIEEIQPGAFNGLSELKTLYLQDNRLKRLSNGAFDGLSSLRYLYLSNNSLSHIEAKAFSGMSRLRKIALEHNQLTTFEDNLFHDLERLKYLNLSGNPINFSKLELKYTSRLTSLDISNISLTDADLQPGMLIPHREIQVIQMSSNLLTNPDCSLLPDAVVLNLSSNALVNLQNVSKIMAHDIDLSNNHLTSVEGFDIYQLYLSNNGIESVSKNLAGQKLVSLILSFNNIAVLNDDTFGNLTSLRNLDLQHNKISKIPPNLFLNTTRLEELNLSFNLIEDIQNGTFNSLLRLERLNIAHNLLTHIQDGTFNSLPWLNELNIAHNRFTILPHLSFLLQLETLRFDFNNITTLKTKDLTDIPSLRNVYLDGNNVECKQLLEIYETLETKVKF